MNSTRLFLSLCVFGSATLLNTACADETSTTAASANTAATDKDAAYTKVLQDRSEKIVAALALDDSAKAARVQARLVAQYRALNTWQEANEGKLKELRKSKDTDAAKPQIEALMASRHALRDVFLADLAKDLTPEQIETVKDKLTYNKLQVTYNGYLQQSPTLTEAQKKKIYDWLVEARDLAVDGVSADEKTEIFGKYKGRINNYLSKEGYNLSEEGKAWKARRDAAAAAEKK